MTKVSPLQGLIDHPDSSSHYQGRMETTHSKFECTLIFNFKGYLDFAQGSLSLNFPKIFRKLSLNLSLVSEPFRVSIPYFGKVQGSCLFDFYSFFSTKSLVGFHAQVIPQ